jgi:hypothetical protein
LTIYSATVSILYALLWFIFPNIASALLILFIALLVGPGCWYERERLRTRDR